MDFGIIRRDNQENGGKSIVGGVSFEDNSCVWKPMSQYWYSGEGLLKDFLHSRVKFQTIPFLVRHMS